MSYNGKKWGLIGCVIITAITVIIVLVQKKPAKETESIKVVILNNNQSKQTTTQQSFDDIEIPAEEIVLPNDRVNVVEELLDKNLPVVPTLRKTNQDRIADKTIEEMVAEVGDTWSATTSVRGVAYNINDPAWIFESFRHNLRVKKLIQLGRQDPEYVGEVVSKDLLRRTNEWFDTAQAYIDDPQGGAFVVGHDGTTHGSSNFKKYQEDTYSIVADLFILMNTEYSKSLDTFAEYCHWYTKPTKYILKLPDGTTEVYDDCVNCPDMPDKRKIDDNTLFAGVSHLLMKSDDSRFEQARDILNTRFLKGRSPSIEVVTDSPDALWLSNDPLPSMAGVDMSSEPTMKLYFQDESLIEDMQEYSFAKSIILSEVAKVYRDTVAD